MKEVYEERDKAINELVAEKQISYTYQDAYDNLVSALKGYNYNGCSCQMRFLPEVEKAQQHICKTKIGPKAIGEVNLLKKNLQRKKDDL